MDLDSLRTHLDSRFDRLDDKLDSHLERISKAEVAIEWIRGHVKIVTAVSLAVGGSMAGILAKLVFGV